MSRKNSRKPTATFAEQEVIHFIGWIVHDLGHRVAMIRNIASVLRRETDFQSPRSRKRLDDLARAADDLATGFGMMRSLGASDEQAICDFVVDVLQPAISVAVGGRRQPRLIIDRTARRAPRVRLRRGPAFLVVGRLIARDTLGDVRCRASLQGSSVIFSLEFSRGLDDSADRSLPFLDAVLREAGVLSFRSDLSEEGRGLIVTLEIGVAQ
jgi:hypothetical protein